MVDWSAGRRLKWEQRELKTLDEAKETAEAVPTESVRPFARFFLFDCFLNCLVFYYLFYQVSIRCNREKMMRKVLVGKGVRA
jgi:hypothetical protein